MGKAARARARQRAYDERRTAGLLAARTARYVADVQANPSHYASAVFIDCVDCRVSVDQVGLGPAVWSENSTGLSVESVNVVRDDHGLVANELECLVEGASTAQEASRRLCELAASDRFSRATPATAMSLNNIAIPLRDRGDMEGARQLYDRSINISKTYGSTSQFALSVALHNKAVLELDENRPAEALKLSQLALDIRITEFGKTNKFTGMTHGIVGSALEGLGRHKEAVSHHKKALQIRTKCFGKYHTETANSLHNLACTLESLGKLDEAARMSKKAFKIRGKLLGLNHPDTLQSLELVGYMRMKSGHNRAAEDLYRRAVRGWQVIGQMAHPAAQRVTRALVVLEASSASATANQP